LGIKILLSALLEQRY